MPLKRRSVFEASIHFFTTQKILLRKRKRNYNLYGNFTGEEFIQLFDAVSSFKNKDIISLKRIDDHYFNKRRLVW